MLGRHMTPRVYACFDAAGTRQYYDRAYDVAWTNLIKASPTYGPQMRKLFSK